MFSTRNWDQTFRRAQQPAALLVTLVFKLEQGLLVNLVLRDSLKVT